VRNRGRDGRRQVGEIAELHLDVVGPVVIRRLERVAPRHVDRAADDDPLVRMQAERQAQLPPTNRRTAPPRTITVRAVDSRSNRIAGRRFLPKA